MHITNQLPSKMDRVGLKQKTYTTSKKIFPVTIIRLLTDRMDKSVHTWSMKANIRSWREVKIKGGGFGKITKNIDGR